MKVRRIFEFLSPLRRARGIEPCERELWADRGAVQFQIRVAYGGDSPVDEGLDAVLVYVSLVVGERSLVRVAHPYPEPARDPLGDFYPESLDGEPVAGPVYMVCKFIGIPVVVGGRGNLLGSTVEAGACGGEQRPRYNCNSDKILSRRAAPSTIRP